MEADPSLDTAGAGGGDDDDDDGLDWLYVEDDFPLSDELAESQIADPGYAGTNFEIEATVGIDYDPYDYWDDVEYGVDEYWDAGRAVVLCTSGREGESRNQAAGGRSPKRKELESRRERQEAVDKRRKLPASPSAAGAGIVRFVSVAERLKRAARQPAFLPQDESQRDFWALLPDWSERFANMDFVPSGTKMPEAMRRAAEAKWDSEGDEDEHLAQDDQDMEEGYDEGREGPGEVSSAQQLLASLGSSEVKAALQRRMAEAGLEDLDEDSMMKTLVGIVSGDCTLDSAAGDLTEILFSVDQGAENDDTTTSSPNKQANQERFSGAGNNHSARVHASATSSVHSNTSPSDSVINDSRQHESQHQDPTTTAKSPETHQKTEQDRPAAPTPSKNTRKRKAEREDGADSGDEGAAATTPVVAGARGRRSKKQALH